MEKSKCREVSQNCIFYNIRFWLAILVLVKRWHKGETMSQSLYSAGRSHSWIWMWTFPRKLHRLKLEGPKTQFQKLFVSQQAVKYLFSPHPCDFIGDGPTHEENPVVGHCQHWAHCLRPAELHPKLLWDIWYPYCWSLSILRPPFGNQTPAQPHLVGWFWPWLGPPTFPLTSLFLILTSRSKSREHPLKKKVPMVLERRMYLSLSRDSQNQNNHHHLLMIVWNTVISKSSPTNRVTTRLAVGRPWGIILIIIDIIIATIVTTLRASLKSSLT